jgi:hypothetical protein
MTNNFDHPPEMGGYKIKAGLKPAEWVARCGLRVSETGRLLS